MSNYRKDWCRVNLAVRSFALSRNGWVSIAPARTLWESLAIKLVVASLLVACASAYARPHLLDDDPACTPEKSKTGELPVECAPLAERSGTSGKAPWQEFDQHITTSRVVAAHGVDLLGDHVSLQDGTLSFSATDINLVGNNALPVVFSRIYKIFNREYYLSDEMLADWEVDVPRVSGTFAPDWVGSSGSPAGRCSDAGIPPGVMPPNGLDQSSTVMAFWQGLQLDIPGVSSGELMKVLPGTSRPATGGPYPWVTNERVHVSCLSTIKNGVGQGFLAIAPDGTRYWFDWMAQYHVPRSSQISPPAMVGTKPIHWSFSRKKNVLYASRVEDRFGNWVTYTYSNAWNTPGRLAEINASDGRKIVVAYSGARIASVQAIGVDVPARTWSYSYQTTLSGRDSLASVTLPDATQWKIAFDQFTGAEIKYLGYYPSGEPVRSCDGLEAPQNWSLSPEGSITHPGGVTGRFLMKIREHGRTNVPLSCSNVWIDSSSGMADNDPNDDVNLFTISYHAFSLDLKELTGPGLPLAAWHYDYLTPVSVHLYPGTTYDWPVCMGPQCHLPPCTSDACAGFSETTVAGPDGRWERHRFGNSFRYNEGKLVSVEIGSGPSSVLRSTQYSHDYARAGRPYPVAFGSSLRIFTDSSSTEFIRPVINQTINQQGRSFTSQVAGDCVSGGQASLCFDQFLRPTKVVKSSFPQP